MILFIFTIVLLLTPAFNVPGPLTVKLADVYIQAIFFVYGAYWTLQFGRILFNRLISPIAIALLVLIIQALILETLYQFFDPTALTIFRLALTIFIAYACAIALIRVKKDLALVFFFKAVIFAALLQGAVIWLSFLSPDFRDFMSLIFFRDLTDEREHLVMLRVPGFAPTGGDGLSMNQALLATVGLMGVFLYFNTSRYRNPLVIALLFSVLSTAFTGRTGLYLGVLFFILVLATQSSDFRISRGVIKAIGISLIILTPIALFSQQLGVYGQALLDEHGYEYPLVRLLGGFIDMQTKATYADETIQTLLTDMVIIPDEPARFLFGNGNFGQLGASFISTDVGYFRFWHGAGLFGLLLFLCGIFIYPLIEIHRLSLIIRKRFTTIDNYKFAVSHFNLLLYIFLFGLISHYKILYLTSRIYDFVFFVLLFLIYNRLRYIEREGNSCVCAV